MRNAKRLGVSILIVLAISTTMLYILQEKLIFLPTKLPANYTYRFDQPFEEVFLDAPDGARLNALHFQVKNPKGVVLYFHGNAGDLSRWGQIVSIFPELGYDAFVMDYRTYGKSTGKLSEEALLSDGQMAYDYIRQNYRESDILIYGRSLGSGIATYLGSRNSPAKILLEAPYYSLVHEARNRFPILPVKWLMNYSLPSYQYIQEVNCPIVIFHGDEDDVISLESGRDLFEVIPGQNKKFVVVPGGGHNNLSDFEIYRQALRKELNVSSMDSERP